ncbi:MAG: hypothetical protein WCC86_01370 [Methanoregula sp.]|uniref:hypothetical protein n=1 Tax=Methanoregula sp. TaxID=2052170 RepID=UPI003BB02D68
MAIRIKILLQWYGEGNGFYGRYSRSLFLILGSTAILIFTMALALCLKSPNGNTVAIGDSQIAEIAHNGSVIIDECGYCGLLVVDQIRILSTRHATISVFGIPI